MMRSAKEAGAAEKRRGRRSRVLLSCLLRTPGGSFEIKLVNLTSVGACASGAAEVMPGTSVELVRGELSIAARVMWTDEDRIGVEFAQPIDAESFRSQHQTAAGPALPMLSIRPTQSMSPSLERRWIKILSQ